MNEIYEPQKKTNIFAQYLFLICCVRFSLTFTESIRFFNLSIILFVCIIAWIFYDLTSDRKLIDQYTFLYGSVCIGGFIGYLSLLSLIGGAYKSYELSHTRLQFIILLVEWVIYNYLMLSGYSVKKKTLIVYLSCILISTLYTMYVGFTGQEDMIRSTAYGVRDDSFLRYGGFDFIYQIVLIYVLLGSIVTRNISIIKKAIVISFMVLIAVTVVVSGYGTAFALIFIATAFIFIDNLYLRGMVIGISFLLIKFSPYTIVNIINAVPNITNLTSSRISEILLSFSGQAKSSYLSDSGQRLDRTIRSLKIFISNPIFGAYLKNGVEFGDHTLWIDMLAKYGIIANLFLYRFWNFARKTAVSQQKDLKTPINNAFLAFVILGFLNPVSMVMTVSPLLILVPCMECFLKEDTAEKKSDN